MMVMHDSFDMMHTFKVISYSSVYLSVGLLHLTVSLADDRVSYRTVWTAGQHLLSEPPERKWGMADRPGKGCSSWRQFYYYLWNIQDTVCVEADTPLLVFAVSKTQTCLHYLEMMQILLKALNRPWFFSLFWALPYRFQVYFILKERENTFLACKRPQI